MARADDDDFVLTLSDNEDGVPDEQEEAKPTVNGFHSSTQQKGKKRKHDDAVVGKGKKKRKRDPSHEPKILEQASDEDEDVEHDAAIDPDFEFQVGDVGSGVLEDFDGWDDEGKQSGRSGGARKGVDLDDIIARRKVKAEQKPQINGGVNGHRSVEEVTSSEEDDDAGFKSFGDEDDELLAEDAFGMGAQADEDEDGSESEQGSEDGHSTESDAENGSNADPVAHPDDDASAHSSEENEEKEDNIEAERRAAFFAPEEYIEGQKAPGKRTEGSFQHMSLSRPILKGLAAVGFAEPTPIQKKAIPVALLGKDVVGGAVTGSGKTAAFMIPILERLLYRPKKVPTTRVAILMPTRELAVQCYQVSKKLASFTDITFAQIVGGFSLREQEQVLKTRPDVVIATPGRFIDHMRNSNGFNVETLEILVLDEADRMLEDGFADELNEILNSIPKSRQTMLFSATMTDSVDKLIRLGLNRPVRLMIDAKRQTVEGLTQEFVRLRPGREEKRLGYLAYLCKQIHTERVIIFFRQKKEAHRIRVIFGLLGLKAAELHGGMTQEQRIAAVSSFRSGASSFLLATDLASRGLDIKNVNTVMNYSAPQSHEIYLHRVGRTARAGRSGRACTLAAESDRKVVRAAVKAAKAQGAKVVSRVVNNATADEWARKCDELEKEVEEVLQEEKEERALQTAERDVKKGENFMLHQQEILSRPKRTWFESEKEKQIAKDKGKVELNGEGMKKKKKLSGKDKKRLEAKDDRAEGRAWKKGKTERAGQGAAANLKASKTRKDKGNKKTQKEKTKKRQHTT